MHIAEKPRGALIITRHYAPEASGSGPVMREMSEWLSRQGWRTDVLTVRPNYPERVVHPGYEKGQHDDAVESGVRVRRLPTWAIKSRSLMARFAPEVRFAFSVLIKRAFSRLEPGEYLISLCPSILTVTAASLLRHKGVRHIAIVHDIPSGLAEIAGLRSTLFKSLLRRLERWTFNRVDHLIVLSSAMEAELRRNHIETPISVLPPPLDTSKLRMHSLSSDKSLTLFYSGTLGRKQGLDQLLDLAAILKDKAPAFRIIICGDGPSRDSLVKRAATLNLPNVFFQPFVAEERMESSFAEADIHLVPQIPLGCDFAVPSKVFAIMASGRPFVATAMPGTSLAQLAEESGAGLAVRPYDGEAFAIAVMELANDLGRRLKMGEAGRLYVETHADIDVVMTSVQQILSGV